MLYFRPLGERDSDEFFADARYGEFWVGARPTLADVELELGITARHIDEFDAAVAKDAGEVTVRLVRDADLELTARLDAARVENGAAEEDLRSPTTPWPTTSRTCGCARTTTRSSRCAPPSPRRPTASRR